MGVVMARYMNKAPINTPMLETIMRPLFERLKAKLPNAPPTNYPLARMRITGAIVNKILFAS